jgi:hypothetical protein
MFSLNARVEVSCLYGNETAPSKLIGANGLPGEITAQGSAVRSTDARSAPLTVILGGKRIVGTVGRAAPQLIRCAWCRRPRDGEQPHTQGSGVSRPASTSRAPSAPARQGRGFRRRHGRRQTPAIPR